jgi:hypothetical protein
MWANFNASSSLTLSNPKRSSFQRKEILNDYAGIEGCITVTKKMEIVYSS